VTAWLFLVAAILSEVTATLSLRVAAAGRTRWYAAVAGGYLLAFAVLALTLHHGMGTTAWASASPTASGPPRASP
jgi:small multidrug resistance pump